MHDGLLQLLITTCQDLLTMQVITLLEGHFKAAGLPAFLRPYTIIPNRTGAGNNIGAILEVVQQVQQNLCRKD